MNFSQPNLKKDIILAVSTLLFYPIFQASYSLFLIQKCFRDNEKQLAEMKSNLQTTV